MVVPTSTPRAFDLGLPPMRLEGGAALPHLHLRGWWWGPPEDTDTLSRLGRARPLADAPVPEAPEPPPLAAPGPGLDPRIPTVLLVHALTGDARAGGSGGWWAPVIGPGRPLDPTRTRLLCFNNLGSCYGSFGPRHPAWPWVLDPSLGPDRVTELPAPVTSWDQARAILRALDALGVERVRVGLGGSLGAMILLALGSLAPDRFEHLVPVAGSESASPWIIGFNHVARQIILQDPDWPSHPSRGLELARQLAQMTYRAEPGLTARQGRRLRDQREDAEAPLTETWSATLPYAQQTYLEHQGRKLVARFDAPSYLTQLSAMDHHDIARPPPPPEPADRYPAPAPWTGRDRLRARIDAVGIDSDVLYPAVHMRALAEARPDGRYHELSSAHGHDAFLIEWDQLDRLLRALGAPFDG